METPTKRQALTQEGAGDQPATASCPTSPIRVASLPASLPRCLPRCLPPGGSRCLLSRATLIKEGAPTSRGWSGTAHCGKPTPPIAHPPMTRLLSPLPLSSVVVLLTHRPAGAVPLSSLPPSPQLDRRSCHLFGLGFLKIHHLIQTWHQNGGRDEREPRCGAGAG